MINHLRENQEQLLARTSMLPPAALSAQNPSPSLTPHKGLDNHTLSPAASSTAIHSFGSHIALQVLSHLGLTFDSLAERVKVTGKPAYGVGESYSTVTLEALVRGIPVYASDLLYDQNRDMWLKEIGKRASDLAAIHQHADLLPAGFRCERFTESEWRQKVSEALPLFSTQMVQCNAKKILLPSGAPAPDRAFSTVWSHQAVPKYIDTSSFIDAVLPELLRVTEVELALYPFIAAGPGKKLLHGKNSAERLRIEAVAARYGFSCNFANLPALFTELESGGSPRAECVTATFLRGGYRGC